MLLREMCRLDNLSWFTVYSSFKNAHFKIYREDTEKKKVVRKCYTTSQKHATLT